MRVLELGVDSNLLSTPTHVDLDEQTPDLAPLNQATFVKGLRQKPTRRGTQLKGGVNLSAGAPRGTEASMESTNCAGYEGQSAASDLWNAAGVMPKRLWNAQVK